jgi:putative ABC transport system permease protein
MQEWKEDFVYQAPISVTVFVWAGLIMTGIAIVTLSFQTIKAARVNPTKYLKEE